MEFVDGETLSEMDVFAVPFVVKLPCESRSPADASGTEQVKLRLTITKVNRTDSKTYSNTLGF